jgi:uncharacterized protein YhbP (UPF0306 family)
MVLAQDKLKAAILEDLRNHSVMTLATNGQAAPYAVSLMYANDTFDIYWLSDPKTRHSEYLVSDSRVAVTIAAQYQDFREIRGLRMEGNARLLTDATEQGAGFDLLLARYPFLKKFAAGKLARHLGAAAIYLFRPTTITLIDNSRGFGFKQSLNPPIPYPQQENPHEFSSYRR